MEIAEKYRRLEACIPGMVYLFALHPDGTSSFPYVNSGSRDLFGIDPEDLVREATLLTDLIHPADRERFDKSVKRSAETLQPWREELRHIVNGEVRWHDWMARPEPQPNGDVVWNGIILDITGRKRTEEELRLTQLCVEQAACGIFRVEEPDGRIVSVNDHACKSLGYTREELCGMTVFALDPCLTLESWREHRRKIRVGGSGTIEAILRRKDGTTYPVEVTVTYVKHGSEEFAFSFTHDITGRKRSEEALRESEERYRSVVDNLGMAVVVVGTNMEVLSANKITRGRFPGVDFTKQPICFEVFNNPPQQEPCSYCAVIKTLEDGRVHETITASPAGESIRHLRVISSPIKDSSGKVTAAVEILEDITGKIHLERDKEKLERQLRQAQKMEAIGTLAGGIAHDFNNMLSVILGYAELIKAKLPVADLLVKDIMEIEKAALRSRDTTRQLLAFSRQQAIMPRPIDLADHILNIRKTLARLIGEDIALKFTAAKDLWRIEFDPSQIDQILVNLVVNSRDAMPAGGQITIEAENITVDGAYCRTRLEMTPGAYVLLQVSDNGTGMEAETVSHIFEPFFTTKEAGVGTGLGLATVYGIVKQNKGFVYVYSEPGRGTTFKIYIPRLTKEGELRERAKKGSVRSGAGTILLVEDDEMVRRMTTKMLEAVGYTVVAAESPTAALSICEKGDTPIDLLMTDVIMPGMNGAELRDRISAILPGIKALFMSGYTSTVISHHGLLNEGVNFIQKPFNMNDLAQKIHGALVGE